MNKQGCIKALYEADSNRKKGLFNYSPQDGKDIAHPFFPTHGQAKKHRFTQQNRTRP